MAPLVWLVTGCSSGLGEQFVHGILARGDKVIATGRQASSRLQHLTSSGAAILDLDVSLDTQSIGKAVEKALSVYGGIDVLVNNAGYMESCYIEELTPEILTRQFSTNLFGPLNLTRILLPHFRSKRSGTFVFIGSICGWRGDPTIASYCASKFALEGLVESLSQETSHLGIQSIIFEPGLLRTQAFSPTTMRHRSTPIEDYGALDEGIKKYLQSTYGTEIGDPRKAVDRILDVVKREGMAVKDGAQMPIRLPLGSDGLAVLRGKCENTLKLCDEYEDLARSTDI
ncbi:MAG: hypothetical protein Q9219_006682 [cf. Caloplaca sp. 3 TL-2023]